jgi:hypothetical protein
MEARAAAGAGTSAAAAAATGRREAARQSQSRGETQQSGLQVRIVEVELVPGGSARAVTDANKVGCCEAR